MTVLRAAVAADLEPLAELWFDGWQDAHRDLLPEEVRQDRTLDSLRERLRAGLGRVRAIGPVGQPLGFAYLKDDELYQFYVARAGRGSGVAVTLLADAEQQLYEAGVSTAWLACAIGNERAARFYEKHGWQRVRTETSYLDLRSGQFALDIWRYEKVVSRTEKTS